MDWQTAADTFVTNGNAILEDLRTLLIAAGVTPSRIVIDSDETEGRDLNVRLTATRGATRKVEIELELSAVRPTGINMEVFVQLFLIVNGIHVGTSYTLDQARSYLDLAGLDICVAKLNDVVAIKPELVAQMRTGLGL